MAKSRTPSKPTARVVVDARSIIDEAHVDGVCVSKRVPVRVPADVARRLAADYSYIVVMEDAEE